MKDNLDFWQDHDDAQERALSRLPKCSVCKDPTQDDFCYRINGKFICDDCLYKKFRVSVDDFME